MVAFSSEIRGKEHIISDYNFLDHVQEPPGMSRGLKPRDYDKHPEGSLKGAKPQAIDLIPRSEWDERIKEQERTKTRLSDHILRTYETSQPIKSLDQNGTNYCWGHGPTTALIHVRCKAGLPYLKLSAVSVCAPVKNFSNVGGWGDQALEYMVKYGINTEDEWPINKISRSYYTSENKEKAKRNTVLEWIELQRRNFDQKATWMLNGWPVASGYNWWSHEVCGIDLVIISASIRNAATKWVAGANESLVRKLATYSTAVRHNVELREGLSRIQDVSYAIQRYSIKQMREWMREVAASRYGSRERNSWGEGYGDKGFFILTESKATPDDSVVPRVPTPAMS